MKNLHTNINNWELNQLRVKKVDIPREIRLKETQEQEHEEFVINEMKKSKLYQV